MVKVFKRNITKLAILFFAVILFISLLCIPLAITPNAGETDGTAKPTFTVIGGKDTNVNIDIQNYSAIYDNNTGSKYCISISKIPYVIFKASDIDTVVTGYTLYTANDTPTYSERNPKDWTLYGSNDNNKWIPIHTVNDDNTLQATQFVGYDFTFENATPYWYYKIEFTAIHSELGSSDLFQISEIDFITENSSVEVQVASEEQLIEAFANGGKAKLATDITLTSKLSLYKKTLSLDLNGHIISGSQIAVYSSSAEAGALLQLKDSRPTAFHADTSLPVGGIISSELMFSRKQDDEDYNNRAYMYADAGTITQSVLFETRSVAIEYSGGSTTTFLNGTYGCGVTINGGFFYGELTQTYSDNPYTTNNKKVEYKNGNSIYATHFVKNNSPTIQPTAPTTDVEGQTFVGWALKTDSEYDGKNYNFSRNITADTTISAVYRVEVETYEELKNALTSGYDVKVMADIKVTETISVPNQKLVLDLNGYVIDNNPNQSISFRGQDTQATIIIIDSRPDSTHTNQSYPVGGYSICRISLYNEGKYVRLYANGGTLYDVYSNSYYNCIFSSSSKPSTIITRSGYGTYYGGYYYEPTYTIGQVASNHRITFKDGNTVYATVGTNASTISAPIEPTKESFQFLGWYNGDNLYDFSSTVTEDLTLIAKWKDVVAPIISGVDATSHYCTQIEVTITDATDLTITVNGENVTLTNGKFNLDMSDGEDKVIVATDVDNNSTTITARFSHSFGDWVPAKTPTCQEVGNYTYTQCSSCKKYEYDIEEESFMCSENEFDTKIKLAKTDHIYLNGWTAGEEPDCLNGGNYPYRQCDYLECDKYQYIKDFTVTDYDAYIAQEGAEIFYCTQSEVATTIMLSEYGHNYPTTWVAEKDANCEENGNLKYRQCSRCDLYEYEYNSITNESTNFEADIVIPALGHSFNSKKFKQEDYDNGLGSYHDYCCETCNAWQNGSSKAQCSINTNWSTNNDYHWHECSICEHKFDYAQHTIINVYNSTKHWKECTGCEEVMTTKEEHVFESATATTCSGEGCDFERFVDLELEIDGYAIDGLFREIEITPVTTNSNATFTLSYLKILTLDGSQILYGFHDKNAAIQPNTMYIVDFTYKLGSVYPAIENDNIVLPEGATIKNYNWSTNSNGDKYIFGTLYLPALGGVSSSTKVDDLVVTMDGVSVGSPVNGVDISFNVPDITIDLQSFTQGGVDIFNDTTFTNESIIRVLLVLIAPQGHNFFGYTADDISISNSFGTVKNVTISEGGGAIRFEVEINSLVEEHTCTFDSYVESNTDVLNNDKSNVHRVCCSICNDYRFENHSFDDNVDTTCNLCGYEREIVVPRIDITLNGYQVDALISSVTASIASNEYGVTIGSSVSISYSDELRSMAQITAPGAQFYPGVSYYLNITIVESSLASVDMTLPYATYINGTLATLYTASISTGSSDWRCTYELPLLTGTSTQQKVTNLTITTDKTISAGDSYEEITLSIPADCGVSAYETTIYDGSWEKTDGVYQLGNSYSMEVILYLEQGYTYQGMTKADVTITGYQNIGPIYWGYSNMGAFIVYEFIIPLETTDEHQCDLENNVIYVQMKNGHYIACQCGVLGELENHVYNEEDPYNCTLCGYNRYLPLEKLEFTFDYYIGMRDLSFEVLTEECNKDYVTLYEEVNLDDNTFTIAISVVPNQTYVVNLVAEAPYYIDVSNLTADKVFLKGIGNSDIVAFDSYIYEIPYGMGGYYINALFNLPALEMPHIHGGTWINIDNPTCTETGVKGHYDCTICGKHFDNDNVEITDLTIPALGHDYGVWHTEVPATCMNIGTKGYKTCSVCNLHFDNEDNPITDLTISVNPDNHEGSLMDGWQKDSTYHWKEYSCCHAQIEKVAHIPDRAEPTESDPVKCTECQYIIEPTKEHVHVINFVGKVDEGCTTNGVKAHYECNGCHAKFEDEEGTKLISDFDTWKVIPASHKFGEWIVEVPATCISKGTKGHKTCSVCNKHFDNKGVEIADLTIAVNGNHTSLQLVEEVKATTTAEGNISYYHCNGCNKYFSDEDGKNEITAQSVILPKLPEIIDHDHDWEKDDTDEGLSLKLNSVSGITAILIDGQEVSSDNYEIDVESNEIRIKPSFLASLLTGEHEVAVSFANGNATAKFTVQEDRSSLSAGAWVGIGLAIAVVVAGIVVLVILGIKGKLNGVLTVIKEFFKKLVEKIKSLFKGKKNNEEVTNEELDNQENSDEPIESSEQDSDN